MIRNFNTVYNHYLRCVILHTYRVKESVNGGIEVTEHTECEVIKEPCNPILEFFGFVEHKPNSEYYCVKFKDKEEHKDNMEVVASIRTKCRLKKGIWLGVVYET